MHDPNTLRTMLKTKLGRRSIFKFCNTFFLPTVKQGNLAQQIACALNKLPDKIAFVNIGGGVTPPHTHTPRSYAPENYTIVI
jgi:hypothetical protein